MSTSTRIPSLEFTGPAVSLTWAIGLQVGCYLREKAIAAVQQEGRLPGTEGVITVCFDDVQRIIDRDFPMLLQQRSPRLP